MVLTKHRKAPILPPMLSCQHSLGVQSRKKADLVFFWCEGFSFFSLNTQGFCLSDKINSHMNCDKICILPFGRMLCSEVLSNFCHNYVGHHLCYFQNIRCVVRNKKLSNNMFWMQVNKSLLRKKVCP